MLSRTALLEDVPRLGAATTPLVVVRRLSRLIVQVRTICGPLRRDDRPDGRRLACGDEAPRQEVVGGVPPAPLGGLVENEGGKADVNEWARQWTRHAPAQPGRPGRRRIARR